MTALEVGRQLVALCKQGKFLDAIDRLYSPNIEGIEAVPMPDMEQTQRGIAQIKGKNRSWADNTKLHGIVVEGPFPHGYRFIVRFTFYETPKQTAKRTTMDEVGLFTVQDGKIVKEEFCYTMG